MAQRLLAGIGNMNAHNMLFQAGIAPDTRVSALKAPERENLAANLARVFADAIAGRTDVNRLPEAGLLGHGSAGAACPRRGQTIEKARVSGRRIYYFPWCQSTPHAEAT